MSERWLENLVRMAGEAERLDARETPAMATRRPGGWTRSLVGAAAAASLERVRSCASWVCHG